MKPLCSIHPDGEKEYIELLAASGVRAKVLSRFGSIGFGAGQAAKIDIGVAAKDFDKAKKIVDDYEASKSSRITSLTNWIGHRVLISLFVSIVVYSAWSLLNASPFNLAASLGWTFFIFIGVFIVADRLHWHFQSKQK